MPPQPQVLGNAKGVVAAMISVAIFRNPVSPVGVVGYCVTVGGVVAYSQVCRTQKLHKFLYAGHSCIIWILHQYRSAQVYMQLKEKGKGERGGVMRKLCTYMHGCMLGCMHAHMSPHACTSICLCACVSACQVRMRVCICGCMHMHVVGGHSRTCVQLCTLCACCSSVQTHICMPLSEQLCRVRPAPVHRRSTTAVT